MKCDRYVEGVWKMAEAAEFERGMPTVADIYSVWNNWRLTMYISHIFYAKLFPYQLHTQYFCNETRFGFAAALQAPPNHK